MIQGPYKRNKWPERLIKLDGIINLLQFIVFLALAAITGFEWISTSQYLKFILIFGGSATSIFLIWLTRSPIFIVTTCAIAFAGAMWR